jgi:AbrB family looped-hinge helix DNA binding protein
MNTSMETTLTDRGQTAIPARIRKRFSLKAGQKLVWVDDGDVIFVAPVALDPIAVFRGSGKKSHLLKALLKSRADDARF